jgi:hypothetical protein
VQLDLRFQQRAVGLRSRGRSCKSVSRSWHAKGLRHPDCALPQAELSRKSNQIACGADSPVRVLHAQPRSPVSGRQCLGCKNTPSAQRSLTSSSDETNSPTQRARWPPAPVRGKICQSQRCCWIISSVRAEMPAEIAPAAHSRPRSSNANGLCWRFLAEPTGVITMSQIHGSRTDS